MSVERMVADPLMDLLMWKEHFLQLAGTGPVLFVTVSRFHAFHETGRRPRWVPSRTSADCLLSINACVSLDGFTQLKACAGVDGDVRFLDRPMTSSASSIFRAVMPDLDPASPQPNASLCEILKQFPLSREQGSGRRGRDGLSVTVLFDDILGLFHLDGE